MKFILFIILFIIKTCQNVPLDKQDFQPFFSNEIDHEKSENDDRDYTIDLQIKHLNNLLLHTHKPPQTIATNHVTKATPTTTLATKVITDKPIGVINNNIEDIEQKVDPYGQEVLKRHPKQVFDIIEKVNEESHETGLYEGDIKEDDENLNSHQIAKRASERSRVKLWSGGIVPYELSPGFEYTEPVRKAMKNIESVSCIKFVPHTKESKRLYFLSKPGCWSYVGSLYEKQQVSVGYGCGGVGTITHELLHALGFYHEQSRPDRDNFININFTNIRTGKEREFIKKTIERTQILNQYDYQSIMHYSATAFSGNGLPTITLKKDPTAEIGQRDSLSPLDIEAINLLYQCKTPINGNWGSWHDFTRCTTTCGNGVRLRIRTCDHPPPSHGGFSCVGIPFETEVCNSQACSNTITETHSCDFDSDLCEWKSIVGPGDNTLTWKRNKGETKSGLTGPTVDHTTENEQGFYVYIESSTPARSGQFGLLKSPTLKPRKESPKRCLTYWTNNYGKSMGTTQVIIKNLETNSETIVREHVGDHGDIWYLNEITFDSTSTSQVIFKGIRGPSWRSDMALDDIHVSLGECPNGKYSCDFEGSTCEWTIHNTPQYPILLNNGKTPSKDTGPPAAYFGSGYIFAESSSPAEQGDKSYIESPVMPPTVNGKRCIKYAYSMRGNGFGELRIYSKSMDGIQNLLAKHHKNTFHAWVVGHQTFDASIAMQIIIEMERGPSYSADIGIDKIEFKDGAC